MKDMIFDYFQESVENNINMNQNILNIISKYNDSTKKINTDMIKAAALCGCLKPRVLRNFSDNCQSSDDSLNEPLCRNCRENLEDEIGSNIFYLTALCSHLGISLYDVFIKEYNKIEYLEKEKRISANFSKN